MGLGLGLGEHQLNVPPSTVRVNGKCTSTTQGDDGQQRHTSAMSFSICFKTRVAFSSEAVTRVQSFPLRKVMLLEKAGVFKSDITKARFMVSVQGQGTSWLCSLIGRLIESKSANRMVASAAKTN